MVDVLGIRRLAKITQRMPEKDHTQDSARARGQSRIQASPLLFLARRRPSHDKWRGGRRVARRRGRHGQLGAVRLRGRLIRRGRHNNRSLTVGTIDLCAGIFGSRRNILLTLRTGELEFTHSGLK